MSNCLAEAAGMDKAEFQSRLGDVPFFDLFEKMRLTQSSTRLRELLVEFVEWWERRPPDIVALALGIADESSWAHLEGCSTERDGWLDVSEEAAGPEFTDSVNESISYLKARGLLEVHPEQPHLVRPLPTVDTSEAK